MEGLDDDIETENEPEEEYRYVLVGNIIDKYYFGENKEIRRGTDHFRPGAKVYLLPEYHGNGHDAIPVYGLPRKSRKKITITIRAVLIKNVRVKKTFDPKMIEMIDKCGFYSCFDKHISSLTCLASFAEYINNGNIELANK